MKTSRKVHIGLHCFLYRSYDVLLCTAMIVPYQVDILSFDTAASKCNVLK